MNDILPSYISTKDFRFIEIDGNYIVTLICTSYPRIIHFLSLSKLFVNMKNINFCYVINKKDKNKVLKKLNYNIATNNAELKSISNNQIDIDIINNIKEDAKEVRRQIQLNNEEIYDIKLYLTIRDTNKEKLQKRLMELENFLFVNNIIVKRANFRQLETYMNSLPIINEEKNEINNDCSLVLSSTLVNMFPFITETLWDNKGILIGKNKSNNSIGLFDIFDERYINSNMTILGSSGAGKSFFLKLHIIRCLLKNILQIIIDIEGEYIKLAKKLDQLVININEINIFDIYINKKNEKILDSKVEFIIDFITTITKMTQEEIIVLRKSIYNIYESKGITNDLNSLKKKELDNITDIQKIQSDMPKFEDLYYEITKVKQKTNNSLSKKIYEFVNGKYSYLNCYTDNELWKILNGDVTDKKIVVINIGNINKNMIKILIVILNSILNNVNINKIIYFDEVWKLINKYSEYYIANYIFELFKTVRKKNAAVIIATQDLEDFFLFENGSYGKSILNNSAMKVYFKTEYINIDFLKTNRILDNNNIQNIKKLKRGNCILNIDNSSILLEVIANEYEKDLI